MEPVEFLCNHENDACCMVLVAAPHIPSVMECNLDCEKYLYNEPVIPYLLSRQHRHLISTLRGVGVTVVDLMEHLPPSDSPSPSLGNLVFTRDPLLCTARGVVVGRFKEAVREKETKLVKEILPSELNIPIVACIQGEGSVVEGGDFIPAGDTCFIGTGNRTNMCGVQEMMDRDLFGTERVVVVKHPADGNMHAIHLDCYMGLVGHAVAVVWDVAADHVTVDEFVRNGKEDSYRLARTDMTLRSYLQARGWTVLDVPTSSQQRYGCNLLYLGNGRVLTQDSYVSEQLTAIGYHPICLSFGELHKMYGGIRCATQVLSRKTKN